MTVNDRVRRISIGGCLVLSSMALFSMGCSDEAAPGGEGQLESDAAVIDAGIPHDFSIPPDAGCDEAEAEAYENLVLGENCPGPCCVEQAGDITAPEGPLDAVKTPTIHSAYNDLPSRTMKSDIPAAQEELRFYVPVAKHQLDGVLEETAASCITNADCEGLTGDLNVICARQDANGDGVTYSAGGATEYAPCLDSESCFGGGGQDGGGGRCTAGRR